jgi:uncharacterized integral membrane protein (TIGR00697 family)
VKKGYSFFLVGLAAVYCVALVVSNLIAGKLYEAPGGIVLPAGVWLFPIVYIIGDVIPEVYGLATARRIILLGFAANLLAVAFFALTLGLPAPGFWVGQEAFVTVLGFTPRLLLASFVGYLVGTNANAWVFVLIKRWTGGRRLWMRTIGSTIVGESLDSACFITIAFLGVVPLAVLPGMILAQSAFKTVYEALATPLTYGVIGAVRRAEAVAAPA